MQYENYPVMISQFTVEKLMSKPNYPDLLALYVFYYLYARISFTNTIAIKEDVIAKRIGWGKVKVSKIRKSLEELNLIESKLIRNSLGAVTKRVTIIKFVWAKKTVECCGAEIDSSIINNGKIDEEKYIKCDGDLYSDSKSSFIGTLLENTLDFPNSNYSISKMDIGVAAKMIEKGILDWNKDIYLNPITGSDSDYQSVIKWWLDGFPVSEHKKLSSSYSGIRFSYIYKKYLPWIQKPGHKKMSKPYETLKVFYARQSEAQDYLASKSYDCGEALKEIDAGTLEWQKDFLVSKVGPRDEYENVIEWWLRNIPSEKIDELATEYNYKHEELSSIIYDLFLAIKSSPEKTNNPMQRIIMRLNYLRGKNNA